MGSVVPAEIIESKILLIRGKKVMFYRDLALLYGVETKALNQAVKRNIGRFPEDFMFQLDRVEADELSRSQLVTLKRGQNIKYLPYAFTENGVAMLSSVLNSERAIEVNIEIMRTFAKLREIFLTHKELKLQLERLERKMEKHDDEIKLIFNAIRQMMSQPEPKKRKIGFGREREG
ncbi:MAG TPA: ORF6N domain-containing protein [Dissulfurispiraceae bacterium]|nr:ORF6N domain-containing protein [Dissulfurispiraceae bacterium]